MQGFRSFLFLYLRRIRGLSPFHLIKPAVSFVIMSIPPHYFLHTTILALLNLVSFLFHKRFISDLHPFLKNIKSSAHVPSTWHFSNIIRYIRCIILLGLKAWPLHSLLSSMHIPNLSNHGTICRHSPSKI